MNVQHKSTESEAKTYIVQTVWELAQDCDARQVVTGDLTLTGLKLAQKNVMALLLCLLRHRLTVLEGNKKELPVSESTQCLAHDEVVLHTLVAHDSTAPSSNRQGHMLEGNTCLAHYNINPSDAPDQGFM